MPPKRLYLMTRVNAPELFLLRKAEDILSRNPVRWAGGPGMALLSEKDRAQKEGLEAQCPDRSHLLPEEVSRGLFLTETQWEVTSVRILAPPLGAL